MDVFQAVADPQRRQILRLLTQQERSVQEIAGHFAISRPAISKHLRVLRLAGLVEERREGRQHIYQICYDRLQELRDWVTYFDQFWLDRLNTLKTYLEGQDDSTD